MGGHGGLNILPQKKWHVFNYDNRLKVEIDRIHAQEEEKEKAQTVERIQSERIFNHLRGEVPSPPDRDQKGNPHHEKEAQAAKDAKIMRSTMYLGQTVSHQSTPWYSRLASDSTSYDFSAAKDSDFYSIIPKKTQKQHKKTHRPKPGRTVEDLRAERLKREAKERRKTEALLQRSQ